jgi:hypothetical protein
VSCRTQIGGITTINEASDAANDPSTTIYSPSEAASSNHRADLPSHATEKHVQHGKARRLLRLPCLARVKLGQFATWSNANEPARVGVRRRRMSMGFTVYYRSTVSLDADRADQIRRAISKANKGRSWLSCEPVSIFGEQEDGHLFGGSKPNFMPHPDDVAEAQAENLPDGTILDVLEILCDVSESHGVDWEFSHDHDPGPIGFVRNGIAESQLREQIDAFAELCGAIGECESDFADDSTSTNHESESGEDDDPPILRLWPGDSV